MRQNSTLICFEYFDTNTLIQTNDIATSNSIIGTDLEIINEYSYYLTIANDSPISVLIANITVRLTTILLW